MPEVPMLKKAVALIALIGAVGAAAPTAQNKAAAPKLTSPKEQFGHDVGDDYFLVNYTQYVEYLKKLDQQSDRMTVVDIGKTEEGRTQYTAIITSPENHKKLAQYKDMNRRLALAEGLTDDQARQLAQQGKTVDWIDGGILANQEHGARKPIQTIYSLNTLIDHETIRTPTDHG